MGRLTALRDELMHNPEFRAGYEQQSQLVRIGHMLRAARESQDLTQTELARRLDIQQSEISRLEKGEGVHGPSFDRIVSVAHALGLKLVVGFSDEPHPRAEESDRLPRLVRVRRSRRVRGRDAVRVERAGDATPADEPEILWGAF
ncbi:helix-turn-helix domain-containing protein [Paraburkholderia sp. BR14320]|uniref:helix-turn-helix domain-containing protein n=1 Tax=unclassified Paraburkholderia TaxID=2615204 RepID=UPI0034CE839B